MNAPKEHWLNAWHVSPTLNRDYDAIDGLRGIAILMVVAGHLIYVNPQSGPGVRFVGALAGALTTGIAIFFTLSGFLIASPFWRRKFQGNGTVIPTGYFARRFWKIYPPLALSVVFFAAASFFATRESIYLWAAGEWLLGLPLFVPVTGELNPAMWSLIVEVHFYLLLPVVFVACRKLSPRTSLWVVGTCILLIPMTYRWWLLSHGVARTLHPEINVHFPSLLDSFAFGVVLAGVDQMGMFKKTWAKLGDWGALVFVAALVATATMFYNPSYHTSTYYESCEFALRAGSALLLCYVANPHHPRTRLLAHPWLRWCGIISYEWYLFHQPIYWWVRGTIGNAQGSWIKYLTIEAGSLALGLGAAIIVYRCFSLPILRFGRNRYPSSERRKDEAAAVPPTVLDQGNPNLAAVERN